MPITDRAIYPCVYVCLLACVCMSNEQLTSEFCFKGTEKSFGRPFVDQWNEHMKYEQQTSPLLKLTVNSDATIC